jgi:hypothetical protein
MNNQYLIRRLLQQKRSLWDERDGEPVQQMRMFLREQIETLNQQLKSLGIIHTGRPKDEEINPKGVQSC